MSMLVITLPPRPRANGTPAATEFSHVLSPNGLAVARQGHGGLASLPRADTVVAVVSAMDIAWHRIDVPKAPPARLRAALGGLLEEQLLADDGEVHFALQPQARAGQPSWVATLDKAWLAAQLAVIEAGGLTVDRVVPALAPQVAPELAAAGHFFTPGADSADVWLALSDAQGARCLRLAGALARALAPSTDSAAAPEYTATPAAAAAAEHWLGAPVQVLTEAEGALAAARSPWNLRQFDLAPRHRGLRALRESIKHFAAPAWRPARWGLVALVGVQLIGLNLWAWHQQRSVNEKRLAQVALLQSTHPQVRAVLDAPLQMERETESLRSAAGKAGAGDLETLLAAAARAWPEGSPPADQLRYDNGRLTIGGAALNPATLQQLRSRLESTGWAVDTADGKLTLGRAPRAAPKVTS